jgi:hypothetical protein
MRTFTRGLIAATCGLVGLAGGFLAAGFLALWWHNWSDFFGLGFAYSGILYGAPPGLGAGIWAALWLTRPRCFGCRKPIQPDQSKCLYCGWPGGGSDAMTALDQGAKRPDDPGYPERRDVAP